MDEFLEIITTVYPAHNTARRAQALISRVRAAKADPLKPPLGTGLVERASTAIGDWLARLKENPNGVRDGYIAWLRRVLADLSNVRDPVAVTREQAETALCHVILKVPIVPFVFHDDGTRGIDLEWLDMAANFVLRELGTAAEPGVTAETEEERNIRWAKHDDQCK